MAIVAVVFARDVREHPHLTAVERAIGNGNAQHIGVQLQVEAVHQAQRLELIFGHVTGQAAAHLIAKFSDAGIHNRLIILVIFIHQITQLPAFGSAGFNVRSGRTVGPSARTRSLIWAGRGPSGVATASIK